MVCMFTKKAVRIPFLADFNQSLFWNLFDSVGTQGLLILYHILFRNFFGAELHGKVGCTLSIFYLMIIVFNIGLDYSLAPFLEYFTRSKQSFIQFLKRSIFPQFCFLLVSTALFYIFSDHIQVLFPHSPGAYIELSKDLTRVLGCTFIIESLKKTAKYFLQLTFYTPLTSCVEVFGMLLYTTLIITSPYLGKPVTLTYTWQVLCMISFCQLLILAGGIYVFYKTLESPDAHSPTKPWPDKRIAKTRLFSWSNQCINQLFSGNFLVPICALHFGLEQASLMKVITSISYWITYIANKVFGVTGNALLAHTKSRTLATQRKAFDYISFLLTQALYGLVIFLSINGKKIALMQMAPTAQITWSLLYFMLLLNFFESFFIVYEKWYILEEKAGIFFFFNLMSFAVLYACYSSVSSSIAMLILIIAVRLATFFALTLFSFYRWNIWPSLLPDIRVLCAALLISLAFYFFF